jgi:hypothetical protein
MVQAPPAAAAKIALPRAGFHSPIVSISQPARPGGCGPRPLAFAGEDQQAAARDDRWAPGTRVAGMPACMAAPMAGGRPAESYRLAVRVNSV